MRPIALALLMIAGAARAEDVVQVDTTRAGLVLHRVDDGKSSVLCQPPCTATLKSGDVLAVGMTGDTPKVAGTVQLNQPSRIRVSYNDRSWLRIAGWGLAIVSLGAGITMMTHGLGQTCDKDKNCTDHTAFFVGGLIVAGIGVPLGIVLGTRPDSARFEVLPALAGMHLRLSW